MPIEKITRLETALNNLSPTDFIRMDDCQLSAIERIIAKLSEHTEAQRLYRGLAIGNHKVD